LAKGLRRRGYTVVFVREPGTTKIGEKVRRILLDRCHDKMTRETEMLLYMAARAQIIEEIIVPALRRGAIVLCDRFLDSTYAYQGYGGGLPMEAIRSVGRIATGGLTPDLTLLLDFWQSTARLKGEAKPDRIESRPDVFHRRVKKGYFALARREPGRIKVVRVSDDIRVTQRAIQDEVEPCLLKVSSGRTRGSRS
jgi:dTMP kinase